MPNCSNCGAPITSKFESGGTSCHFCGALNLPPPQEVPVPARRDDSAAIAPIEPKAHTCPHCRGYLFGLRVRGIELDGCRACGGIWVDNAAASELVAAPLDVFGALAARCAESADRAPPRRERPECPMCPAILEPTIAHGIRLDICKEHGTWFDAGELDLLLRTLRGEVVEPKPAREGSPGVVRCARCKEEILAERANLTEKGLACERCWRAEVTAQVAADEQAHREQTLGAVAGVAALLLGGRSRS